MSEDEAKRLELLALRDRIMSGEENSTPEGKRNQLLLSGGLTVAIFLGIAATVVFDNEPSSAAKTPPNAQSTVVEDQGKDCFSSWNGSSTELVSLVTKLQGNPESFQHTRTHVGAGSDTAHKSVVMEYRSTSNFGGQIFGKAHAIIDVRDCTVSELSVNER